MAKSKFYGVYGYDGGGVYNNWDLCLINRPSIPGFKTKSFNTRQEAIQFIILGLTLEYQVCRADEIVINELYTHTNLYMREGQLIQYKMNNLIEPPFIISL